MTHQWHLVICFYLVAFGLASCGGAGATPSGSATVTEPVPSQTAIVSKPSATLVKSSQTATATPKPSATAAPLPTSTVIDTPNLEGSLWLLTDHKQPYYLRVDMKSGETKQVKIPPACTSSSLPASTYVICRSQQELSLLDLQTGVSHILPFKEPDWFDLTGNRQLLYYGFTDTGGSTIVYSYNLAKAIETSVATVPNNLITIPALSSDGAHLVFVRDIRPNSARIFESIPGTATYRQVGPNAPPATWAMTWSPTAAQLIFGATDVQSEIGYFTNYLYLLDFDSHKTRLLIAAPKGESFGYPLNPEIWSSDGENVALSVRNTLCVVSIVDSRQECISAAPESYDITGAAWSPDGTRIAFGMQQPGLSATSQLMLYEPATRQVTSLLKNTEFQGLFWVR